MKLFGASLGLKLNLALLAFFIILGGATAALIYYGFSRTQDNASERSQEALEELGKVALQEAVDGQTSFGSLALETAGEMGFQASTFLQNAKATGQIPPFDPSTLSTNEIGTRYDSNPNRTSDLAIPNFVELTPEVIEHIEYSSALDRIVPTLMQSYPETIRDTSFNPVAFAYTSPEHVTRYYPPIGIHQALTNETKYSDLPAQLGPVRNPERKTKWSSPYEDAAGRGLVITANYPVYDGDVYRGVFQIDVSLEELGALIDELKLTQIGFAFYVSSDGRVMQGSSFDTVTRQLAYQNQDFIDTIAAMRAGKRGVDRVVIDGREMFIGYSPMAGVGGSLAIAASVEELTAEAAAITAGIDDEGQRTLQVSLVAMSVLFAIGLIGATYLNKQAVLRPIAALVSGTRSVAGGNLETTIKVPGEDEFATLAGSFNQMTADLRQRRDALRLEIEERQAAQDELRALFAAMTDRVVVFNSEGRFLRIPVTEGARLLIEDRDRIIGKTLHEVRPKDVADAVLTAIQKALANGTTVNAEFPYEVNGERSWLSAIISPLDEETVLAVVRDITDTVNAREEVERQVVERTRELQALLDISMGVASNLELEPLLETIVEQIGTVIEYGRASLFLVRGETMHMVYSRTNPARNLPDTGFTGISPLPLATFEPAWSHLKGGRYVIIDDVRADTEFGQVYRRVVQGQEHHFIWTRSLLVVPLVLKERSLGMMTVSHPEPGYYNDDHAHLMMAIASQAAIAVENARLYEQAQQVAAVEERQRLARELHDSVSQALYGIALGARTARTLLDQDAARAVQPVDYVLSLAEAGLAEMRSLIFELRPESLEIEGVVVALEKQVAATAARYGIEVTAELGEEPDISLPEKETVYRIAQEALHNVVKHARATSVQVSLANGDGLTLQIRDNGVGFDSNQSFPGHMGLVSMTERALNVGASLNVSSKPGEGTTVTLSLPAMK